MPAAWPFIPHTLLHVWSQVRLSVELFPWRAARRGELVPKHAAELRVAATALPERQSLLLARVLALRHMEQGRPSFRR